MPAPLSRPLLAAALAALALAAAGCPAPGAREGTRPRSYEPRGRTVIVVLDGSGSMEQYDPDRLSIEGAHLVAGLVDEGDNVGAVRFSSDARVIAPVRTLRAPEDRRALCDEVRGARPEGSTNYVAALRRAREALEGVNAPPGAAVLFMTDGEHNTGGTPADVLALVAEFARRGWRIHALGYGPEGRSELLSELAARTGGGLFLAGTPRELLLAFLKITEELQGLMISDRIAPVRVFPGTGRLVYVALKGARATRIARIARDGAPVPLDGPRAYRYPGPGERSDAFDLLRFERPEAGRWDATVEGPSDAGVILQESPFEVRFAEDAPGREHLDGRPLRVTVLLEGERAGELRRGASVSASVAALDGRALASLDLAAAPAPDARTLAWSGEVLPRLRDPKRPETHTVRARFTYRDGEVAWTHDRTVSYRLVPPPSAFVDIEPATIDLGTVFAGEASREVEATVRASGEAGRRIEVAASEGVRVSPAGALTDVGPGGARVRISVLPPEGAQELAGTVAFLPAGAAGREGAPAARLAVRARVARLRIPSAVSLGDVQAGETASVPVAISGDDPRIDLPPLEGPERATLTAALLESDGRQSVEVAVPLDARPGRYRGALRASVGAATRSVPVELNVLAPPPRLRGLPARISFVAEKNGWTAEQRFEATLADAGPCTAGIAAGDLAPADGSGRRPLRAGDVALAFEGLEGGALAPGRKVALTAKVRVVPDLAGGRYVGRALVRVTAPDGRASVAEVPLELTLTR